MENFGNINMGGEMGGGVSENNTLPEGNLMTSQYGENLMHLLAPNDLSALGQRVYEEFKIDYDSNSEDRKTWNDAMDLALQKSQAVLSGRWQGACNLILPLITKAALSFANRSYPNIIKDGEVCKYKVVGSDDGKPVMIPMFDPRVGQVVSVPAVDESGAVIIKGAGEKASRGVRATTMINWQCLSDMPNWESDMDRMLYSLAILGTMYKKVWYDPSKRKMRSQLLFPNNFVVNNNINSLQQAPRMTELLNLYPHEIEAYIASGYFVNFDFESYQITSGKEDLSNKPIGKGNVTAQSSRNDPDCARLFLQQCRYLEIPGMPMLIPVVVTVFEPTKQVVRLVKNFDEAGVIIGSAGEIIDITPQLYYVPYKFLENPSGAWNGIGFGHLLNHLNRGGNALFRQLVDAGTLANIQGGFIEKGVRMSGGQKQFDPTQWNFVESTGGSLRESLFPLPTKEPSPTLFALLQYLIEYAEALAGLSDTLAGEMKDGMKATAALGQIEQALVPYKAQFKRVYRSLVEEFKIMAQQNSKFLNAGLYSEVVGEEANPKVDFDSFMYNIVPVADLDNLTNIQKIMKIQSLREALADSPYVNKYELDRRTAAALSLEDLDSLFVKPEAVQIQQEQEKAKQDMIMQELVGAEKTKAVGIFQKDLAQADKYRAETEKVEVETEKLEKEIGEESDVNENDAD